MIKQQNFSTYFNDWLYGEEGYYTQYNTIGKEGDFYTAVSTSEFFGGSIAKRIVDSIESGFLPNNTTVVEIGAHHGYLLADIVQFIYTLKPHLLETLNFAIVEKFEHLKEKQIEYFKQSFEDVVKIHHYKDVSEVVLDDAYIVANEIFDAFACELIYTNKEKQRQYAVVNDHKISFIKCEDNYLNKICDKYKIQKGEIGIGYEKFVQTICTNIKKFEFLSFDYGDIHVRNDFSTRVYTQHKVFPIFEENLPLKELFSSSDITYDVNFSHLIDCFKEHNCEKIIFRTQLKTLVEFGIQDLLQMVKEKAGDKAYSRQVQRVKTLIEPMGMGERFKSILVQKVSNN